MSYIGPDPASVRHFGAEEAFRGLKLSRRAVTGLIRAGVLTPAALAAAAWTDEEARAKFSSLRWRLSVDPECGSKVVAEVERARTQLLASAPGRAAA